MKNKQKRFDFSRFMESLQSANNRYSDQERKINYRILRLYREIMRRENITDEFLQSVTQEELEWILDMVMYWPSYEAGAYDEDWDHIGVQSFQIEDIIQYLGQMPTVRREVAFF